jgi:hypothetical protein
LVVARNQKLSFDRAMRTLTRRALHMPASTWSFISRRPMNVVDKWMMTKYSLGSIDIQKSIEFQPTRRRIYFAVFLWRGKVWSIAYAGTFQAYQSAVVREF